MGLCVCTPVRGHRIPALCAHGCVDAVSQLCVHAGVHIQQGSLPPGAYASDAGSWSCPVGSSGRPSPGLLSPLPDASEPRLTRVE